LEGLYGLGLFGVGVVEKAPDFAFDLHNPF
jgi:hypothetical protein